ncbi:hypothetical protein BHE74_00035183 [Ensete ventricosum]|nr:hypothetical protein BHE74_00035183 [Ensete ventricosum]
MFVLISTAHEMLPLRFPDNGIRAKGWSAATMGLVGAAARPQGCLQGWSLVRGTPVGAACMGIRSTSRGSAHGGPPLGMALDVREVNAGTAPVGAVARGAATPVHPHEQR